MHYKIITINLGGINCYLINYKSRYILIDTGYPAKCKNLEKKILNTGCKPRDLELIILTHGDHDHAGNGAYLRQKFNTKIAMHVNDSGMVKSGDQSDNRKSKADYFAAKFKLMSFFSYFFDTGKFTTFEPDIFIHETLNLSEYGFIAKIVHIPGHSQGSIGVVTENGQLFCGDLIYNFFKPEFLYIDDLKAAKNSIEKLRALEIKKVYPGHGKPFSFTDFVHKYYERKFFNK